MQRPLYVVYEITRDCRKNGKVVKRYLSKKTAEKCMNKSIFRFIRESVYIS